GRGVMTVGSEQHEVGPGDAIYIPREHQHTLANTGSEPVRLLVVCGPAFFYEDEIKDAREQTSLDPMLESAGSQSG
ncbi:MAG TPA: cupin domain-containing protein, partial [Blastocatellia bacterium]|nr:cupin domain-containing protein [Blastocatellia bacterium]